MMKTVVGRHKFVDKTIIKCYTFQFCKMDVGVDHPRQQLKHTFR